MSKRLKWAGVLSSTFCPGMPGMDFSNRWLMVTRDAPFRARLAKWAMIFSVGFFSVPWRKWGVEAEETMRFFSTMSPILMGLKRALYFSSMRSFLSDLFCIPHYNTDPLRDFWSVYEDLQQYPSGSTPDTAPRCRSPGWDRSGTAGPGADRRLPPDRGAVPPR